MYVCVYVRVCVCLCVCAYALVYRVQVFTRRLPYAEAVYCFNTLKGKLLCLEQLFASRYAVAGQMIITLLLTIILIFIVNVVFYYRQL